MTKTKNDVAWEKVFEKHNILKQIDSQGFAEVSAFQLNQFREARLMAKFDHRSQLPKIFSQNKLSILPISRGTYAIGCYETFHDITLLHDEHESFEFPDYIESISYKDITSEAIAINCAYVSDILKIFTNEEHLFPTLNGRMSSSQFSFKINRGSNLQELNINNSQIEIDGGFEGSNSLVLIEAKNYLCDDFSVRQLYFPFRLWHEKLSKKVRPVFLNYSNGIFYLREYEFENPELFNSIRLVKQKSYAVKEHTINHQVIQKLLNQTPTVPEPKMPFPQADKFERVINLCELLKGSGFINKEDITQNYDFVERQTDYYANAAIYLGWVERTTLNGEIGFSLTEEGIRIFSLPIWDRQLEFIKTIVSYGAFRETLELYYDKSSLPTKSEVVEIMKKFNLYNIGSDDTYRRRASTVISWVDWIVGLHED